MKLLYGLRGVPDFEASAVTIGNFDGVHLGHQQLISRLKEQASLRKIPSVVIVLEPQPTEFFCKQNAPARLSTLREKIIWLKQLKVDYVYCLKFNKNLATMPYELFAKTYFYSRLKAQYIILGQDFHFGYNREGTIEKLKELAFLKTCAIECFNDVTLNNKRVSSTEIRQLLELSQLQEASVLLGKHYSICGRVVKGKGQGRQWGIPTANIQQRYLISPIKGVFFVQAYSKEGEVLNGVANIGYRPTVDGQQFILEIHFLELNKDLYGKFLQIVFLHKLRDEVKFSSVDALIAQIKADIEAGKRFFELY